MKTLRMTFMYIKRGVFSLKFIGCTFLTVMLMTSFVYLDYINNIGSALYYFYQGIESSGSVYFLIMLASMPGIVMFCEDWSCGVFDFLMVRSGRRKYAFSVIFGSATVSSLSILLSYIFFSLVILAKYPLVPAISTEEIRISTIGMINSGLLTVKPILFYVIFILNKVAMAAFYTSVGIVISTAITDIHLTIVLPVLMNVVFGLVAEILQPPFWLDLRIIFSTGAGLYLNFGGDLDGSLFSVISAIYPFVFTFVMVILFSLIENKIIKFKQSLNLGAIK